MDFKLNTINFIENFISEDQENNIINEIISFREKNPKLVANYGNNNYDSIYFGERYKKEAFTFPDYLKKLCDELIKQNLLETLPYGIAINKYKKGQKIAPHIDKEISGPIVTILSIGSKSTMVFSKDKEKIPIELHRRSIIQMKDEARWEWKHEILPVPDVRYSLIFRSMR